MDISARRLRCGDTRKPCYFCRMGFHVFCRGNEKPAPGIVDDAGGSFGTVLADCSDSIVTGLQAEHGRMSLR